jgi:glycosyltransferase 2 family protein
VARARPGIRGAFRPRGQGGPGKFFEHCENSGNIPSRCANGKGGVIENSKRWRWVALLAVATLMIIYGFAQKREIATFDWPLFGASLLRLDWRWMAAAGALCMASYAGRALRWSVLMWPVKPNPSFWGITSATIIGFAAVVVLGRPGEFVRPYLIAMREKVPVSSQLAAWMLERIFDILLVMLIFGFALSQVSASRARPGPALQWILAAGGWIVGITCVLGLGILLAIRHFSEPMRSRLLGALGFLREHHYLRAERLVNAFVQGVASTRSDRSMVLLVVYSCLDWALIVGCYYAIAKAYGPVLGFTLLDSLILMGFLSFGAAVQVPGVGGGVQVMAVLVLNELFRVPLEIATGAALVFWITTFVVAVPFGVVLAIREGLSWSRLRDIGKEADW